VQSIDEDAQNARGAPCCDLRLWMVRKPAGHVGVGAGTGNRTPDLLIAR
jgi:hypothetical protein